MIEQQTRRKRKNLAKAQAIVGPSARVTVYVSGTGSSRMTTGSIVTASCFGAAAVAVFLLTGRIASPGILLIVLGFSTLRPGAGSPSPPQDSSFRTSRWWTPPPIGSSWRHP